VTLFKRGKLWWAYFTIDGVRHQESTGTPNRRSAERILKELKEQANLERHHIADFDPEITFAAVAEQFLSAGPSFFNQDRLKHLLPFFRLLKVRELTRNKVYEYRTARKAITPLLTDSTLNKDVGVLRHTLNWAVEAELIPINPIPRPPMISVRRIPKPILTVSEEEQLLTVAKPHLRNLILAALDTGMRRGELLAERWDHVDLARKLLFVSFSKTVAGHGREIPLTARMIELLGSLKHGSLFVFDYRGKPIRDLKTAWNTTQRKAGLVRHFRFHDLRHCFATRLMEAGVIVDVRKVLMGHVDRSVHGGYTHVSLPAKREAILKMEQWVAAEKRREAICCRT
jgi:integrase